MVCTRENVGWTLNYHLVRANYLARKNVLLWSGILTSSTMAECTINIEFV